VQTYTAPLTDFRFLLQDVFEYSEQVVRLPGYEEATLDTALAVMAEAAAFSESVLLPLNTVGDREGCRFDAGRVFTPTGFREAHATLAAGGWCGVAIPAARGGSGLPEVLSVAFEEMACSGNLAFATYPLLTAGAANALCAHASEEQIDRYVPRLASGEWSGTMCLTEPQAGTDLGLLTTRATPTEDGGHRISGTKIFITAGDHDLTEQIVHLVLARLPDAPPGTAGISLFIVPKRRVGADGQLGERNGVECASIEHKMGIRGSATCMLVFDDAVGELVGAPHTGMAQMFTMMNRARLGVGVQGVGMGEIAYQSALAYARERRQGRAPGTPRGEADPIIVHPDVRRVLLRMRSLTEAGRALALWLATEMDISHHHPNAARREASDDLVALLTPIMKAACTDNGAEAAGLAVGVYGGHGYITESGVEQLARDARISQIYEGTNGVQALDLAGRKLALHQGRLARRFFHLVDAQLAADHPPEAGEFVDGLRTAFARLQDTTIWLVESGQADGGEIAAGATDYLRLFALTVFASLWLRMAEATLASPRVTPEFRHQKLATGRFFVRRILPETAGLAEIVQSGNATIALIGE
jgi:alkylation response protein AidB-like acyl-CoA dehydrogenase